jgi:uncharacterized membrane protein YfcA
MDLFFTIPLHSLILNSIPLVHQQTYSLLTILLSLVSGTVVGFSLGLIGGGGSILAVPLLIYVVGVADAHVAIGTSALAVGVNALNNMIHHYRVGHVKIKEGLMFAIPGIIGSIFGAQLGLLTPSNKLLFLFGIFMIIISVMMLRKQQKQSLEVHKNKNSSMMKRVKTANRDHNDGYSQLKEKSIVGFLASAPGSYRRSVLAFTTNKLKQLTIGFIVGLAAGYFGIGGGFIIVPSLMHLGLNIIDAIGTSLIPVSMFGFSTAIRYSFNNQIEWIIALLFIIGGIGGGILGTKFVEKAPKKMLSNVFAILLMVVAIYIILRSVLFV